MTALYSTRRQVPPRRSRARRDDGQAAVEAAIVMPSMVFLILGILQLTMVQHARIMTEYAAYCAARAGIVYNADKSAMTRAAELALLPTMGRTDTLATFAMAATRSIAVETSQRTAFQLPIVNVTILSPTKGQMASGISKHLLGSEIDFDDVRADALQANILQIKLEYYYHMKIPFANQMLQLLFFAEVGHAPLVFETGGQSGLETSNATLTNHVSGTAMAGFAASGRILTPLAGNLVTAARHNFYYFPIQATYSMRMQSNVYNSSLAGAAP